MNIITFLRNYAADCRAALGLSPLSTASIGTGLQLTNGQTLESTGGGVGGGGAGIQNSLTPASAVFGASVDAVTGGLALKANLISPTFTGAPLAPTASPGANSTQLATTAYADQVKSSLVNSAPANLDTLAELATALGNDPAFSTTTAAALALKASLTNLRSDALQVTANVMGGTAIDPTRQLNRAADITANATYTWLAAPAVDDAIWHFELKNAGSAPFTITVPQVRDMQTGALMTSFPLEAQVVAFIAFRKVGSEVRAYGIPQRDTWIREFSVAGVVPVGTLVSLMLKAARTAVINEVVVVSGAGTDSMSLTIDGVAVAGSPFAIGTTEATFTPGSANTVTVNQDVKASFAGGATNVAVRVSGYYR